MKKLVIIFFTFVFVDVVFADGFISQKYVGLNFVSNFKREPLGFSSYIIHRGIGYYAEYKTDYRKPASDVLYENITIEEAGDNYHCAFIKSRKSYSSYNNGFIIALADDWAIYLGAGYTEVTGYLQYYHPDEIFGEKGMFWIKSPNISGFYVNYQFGSMFKIGNFILQAGVDSAPMGFVVGGGLAF